MLTDTQIAAIHSTPVQLHKSNVAYNENKYVFSNRSECVTNAWVMKKYQFPI